MASISSILLLSLYLFVSFVFAYPSIATLVNVDNARNMFNNWMVEHEVSYTNSKEEQKRFEIFSQNLQYINDFNSKGNQTYRMGLNQISDLTVEEFRSKIGGCLKSKRFPTQGTKPYRYESNTDEEVPSRVDWVERGALNPTRSQGPCGSCWAVSAITTMEAIVKIRTGVLQELSLQQVLDCDTISIGCEGGRFQNAFNYTFYNGGLASESSYPYVAKQGACRTDVPLAAKIDSWNDLPENNEEELMKAVAKQPVSAGIFLGFEAFMHYNGGVVTHAEACNGQMRNHAIVIVGYGTSDDGIKYWRIRNTWGPKWGEGGHARIAREIPGKPGGLCGVAEDVSVPL